MVAESILRGREKERKQGQAAYRAAPGSPPIVRSNPSAAGRTGKCGGRKTRSGRQQSLRAAGGTLRRGAASDSDRKTEANGGGQAAGAPHGKPSAGHRQAPSEGSRSGKYPGGKVVPVYAKIPKKIVDRYRECGTIIVQDSGLRRNLHFIGSMFRDTVNTKQ